MDILRVQVEIKGSPFGTSNKSGRPKRNSKKLKGGFGTTAPPPPKKKNRIPTDLSVQARLSGKAAFCTLTTHSPLQQKTEQSRGKKLPGPAQLMVDIATQKLGGKSKMIMLLV